MAFLDVIGFTYEADIHCPDCTVNEFGTLNPFVLDSTIDREGNPVTAYLEGQHTADTESDIVCGDCGVLIFEVESTPRKKKGRTRELRRPLL